MLSSLLIPLMEKSSILCCSDRTYQVRLAGNQIQSSNLEGNAPDEHRDIP